MPMRQCVLFQFLVSFKYIVLPTVAFIQKISNFSPFSGLCTSKRKIHAKIILAGDPKQLDAVTRSHRAKQLGFNTSWLEHLCNTKLYSRNSQSGTFNAAYITQLVKNYRSHPQILCIPNELFYENKLEPIAPESNIFDECGTISNLLLIITNS